MRTHAGHKIHISSINRDIAIVSEWCPMFMRVHGGDVQVLIDALEARGFRAWNILEYRVRELAPGTHFSGNDSG
jgi:hypothetical protein